jgi:hypothetical protein
MPYTPSDDPEPSLHRPHQPVQKEADEADGDDRQENVGVDEAIVFLPKKTADARRPVSISEATMTSQAIPSDSLQPVKM